MSYHILTHRGTVITRSTVQGLTNLELSTPKIHDIFHAFDDKISSKLKSQSGIYQGDKPDPEDWKYMFEEDDDFKEEFDKVFNNTDIPEADTPTPEVLDDTYLNMEISLPRDSDGPEFARVAKRLRDANGIPIGTANDNPILDSRLYEVEYLDGHKASLAANAIDSNLFSQIDNEGNRHTLFDSISDHRCDGSELQETEAYITSANGGR